AGQPQPSQRDKKLAAHARRERGDQIRKKRLSSPIRARGEFGDRSRGGHVSPGRLTHGSAIGILDSMRSVTSRNAQSAWATDRSVGDDSVHRLRQSTVSGHSASTREFERHNLGRRTNMPQQPQQPKQGQQRPQGQQQPQQPQQGQQKQGQQRQPQPDQQKQGQQQ